MKLTQTQLVQIMPHSKNRIAKFVEPLNDALQEFNITGLNEVRMFIAQLAHESGEFRYTEEIASGIAYDTGKKAVALGNTPEADGDGQKYKGRGLIQTTGFYNYLLTSMGLDLDLINHPELLAEPVNACRSAAFFWHNNKLSRFCNPPTDENFKRLTRAINGGYNGLDDRIKYWQRTEQFIG